MQTSLLVQHAEACSSEDALLANRTTSRFQNYLDPSTPLEEHLSSAFKNLKIDPLDEIHAREFLALLRLHHAPSYEHSIRVGLLCQKIGAHLEMVPRAETNFFLAGLLHDIGKIKIPRELLEKTDPWTADDHKIVQAHVLEGYYLLKEKFGSIVGVISQHHLFQENYYPRQLPQELLAYSPRTREILSWYALLLSLADVYDALHRINAHNGKMDALCGETIKERMLALPEAPVGLVSELYSAGVFSTHILGRLGDGARDHVLNLGAFNFS